MLETIKLRFTKSEFREKFFVSVSSGITVFFILYVYEAFNIYQGESDSGHSWLFRSIIFGLATLALFLILEYFLKDWFFKTIHTFQYVLWVVTEIFIGANLTFLLFNYFWNWNELYWGGYFLLLSEYAAMVVLPITLSKYLNKTKQAPSTEQDEVLHFHSENRKNKVSIKADAFLYLKSEDNYIEIFYLSDGEVKSDLLRNTLKNIETAFRSTPYLMRCHRGYIINPKKIVKVTELKRQVTLELGHSIEIPVSQKYISSFKVES